MYAFGIPEDMHLVIVHMNYITRLYDSSLAVEMRKPLLKYMRTTVFLTSHIADTKQASTVHQPLTAI